MMLEVTLNKLHQMKLFGMAEALVEHNHSAMYSSLPLRSAWDCSLTGRWPSETTVGLPTS